MRAQRRCKRDAVTRAADAPLRPRALGALGALVLALGVFASGVAACTGEKTFVLPSVDAGAPSGRYDAVCAAWARRECAYTHACDPGIIAGWDVDDQCIARETLSCELEANNPDVPFDPALVAACTFPSDCSVPTGTTAANSPYLCLAPGKAPAGAPCVSRNACQSGLCLTNDGSRLACGTCHPPIHCGCARNQQCMVTGDDAKCFDVPDAGEACGPPLFACNGSECVDPGNDGGICQTLPEVGLGASCTAEPPGPQCFSPGAGLLYCDHTDHCSAYRSAGYGQPCTTARGAEGTLCGGAGWCDSASGVCQPPAADGAPCDPLALPCLPPAMCLGGHCVFPTLATCSL